MNAYYLHPMKTVRIHDKVFGESLSEENIIARVKDLARVLNKDYSGKDPVIISVLNGAFIFTSDLVKHLSFDPEIQFIRLSSYKGGLESSGEIDRLLDIHVDLDGKDVLIVEDIVDTGNTLEWLRGYFKGLGAATVNCACLLFKEEVFKKEVAPEYYCFRIPADFVVGYGLDYAERGRNLKSIYKLKD